MQRQNGEKETIGAVLKARACLVFGDVRLLGFLPNDYTEFTIHGKQFLSTTKSSIPRLISPRWTHREKQTSTLLDFEDGSDENSGFPCGTQSSEHLAPLEVSTFAEVSTLGRRVPRDRHSQKGEINERERKYIGEKAWYLIQDLPTELDREMDFRDCDPESSQSRPHSPQGPNTVGYNHHTSWSRWRQLHRWSRLPCRMYWTPENVRGVKEKVQKSIEQICSSERRSNVWTIMRDFVGLGCSLDIGPQGIIDAECGKGANVGDEGVTCRGGFQRYRHYETPLPTSPALAIFLTRTRLPIRHIKIVRAPSERLASQPGTRHGEAQGGSTCMRAERFVAISNDDRASRRAVIGPRDGATDSGETLQTFRMNIEENSSWSRKGILELLLQMRVAYHVWPSVWA
ncbi:uncharacterized protein EV420DRAFT_1479441 [Desarmillaria tabescens]|uniref:Uncharacterized protein n=1 Tax=Armillaria tabescens TaxID=1929756 RepID=A0AA39N615_ARMTA|nr:uncharacterized protein EV420DRAFT_1479441 [Desarmillaria tabescens]KAK0458749.1 hypothetical protein EV420DRAFT_1479441 [Desarmillaria tabescens]